MKGPSVSEILPTRLRGLCFENRIFSLGPFSLEGFGINPYRYSDRHVIKEMEPQPSPGKLVANVEKDSMAEVASG